MGCTGLPMRPLRPLIVSGETLLERIARRNDCKLVALVTRNDELHSLWHRCSREGFRVFSRCESRQADGMGCSAA